MVGDCQMRWTLSALSWLGAYVCHSFRRVLQHLVYLGFGDPDQPHPVGCDLYITQWFMKKILPLDRRDGLLGTSVRIEGDQASVVIPS